MRKSNHHHQLLFSSWFPYLWKAIYKPLKSYYSQEFYGNEKIGYYCKLTNGLTFKIFRHGEGGTQGAVYAVYIYHNNELIMNYNTLSNSYVFVVTHNPFSYTANNDISYLIASIKKTLPKTALSVFDDFLLPFDELPVLSLRISSHSEYDRFFFHSISIKYHPDKLDLMKATNIQLVKSLSAYYSSRVQYSYSFGKFSSIFTDRIADSDIKQIKRMINYTHSGKYYILYELSPPDELMMLAAGDNIIVAQSKGFMIESDNENYYFMFNNGFISRCDYRNCRMGEHIIFNLNKKEDLESVFFNVLKEVMLSLQKRKPSDNFCTYLSELGIEGTSRKKSLTDEQWLLYEMNNI